MTKKFAKTALCVIVFVLTCICISIPVFAANPKVQRSLQANYTDGIYRGILLEKWDTVDSKTQLTAYQLIRESFVQDMKPTMDTMMSAIETSISENKNKDLTAVYKGIAEKMASYKLRLYSGAATAAEKDEITDELRAKSAFFSDMYSLPLYHWNRATMQEAKLSKDTRSYLNFLVNNTWYSVPVGDKGNKDFLTVIRRAEIEALNEYSYSVYEIKAGTDKLLSISGDLKLDDKNNISLQYYVNPLIGVYKVNNIEGSELKSDKSILDYIEHYYTTKTSVDTKENKTIYTLSYTSSASGTINNSYATQNHKKYGDTEFYYNKGYNFSTDKGVLSIAGKTPWLMQSCYYATSADNKRIEYRARINPTYLEWYVGHYYNGWDKGGLYSYSDNSLSFVPTFKRLDSSVSAGNVFINTIVPVTYISQWNTTKKAGIYSYMIKDADAKKNYFTPLGTVGIRGKGVSDFSRGWRYSNYLQNEFNSDGIEGNYSKFQFSYNSLDAKKKSSTNYKLYIDNIYTSTNTKPQCNSVYYNLSTGKYCTYNRKTVLGLSNATLSVYGKYKDENKNIGEIIWHFDDSLYYTNFQTDGSGTNRVPTAVLDTLMSFDEITFANTGKLQLMSANYVCGADELPDLKFSSNKNSVLVQHGCIRTVAVATEFLEAVPFASNTVASNIVLSTVVPVTTGRSLSFKLDNLKSVDMLSGNQAVIYNKAAASDAIGSHYSQNKISLSNASSENITYKATATPEGIALYAGSSSYNSSGLLNWLQTSYASEYMSKYSTSTNVTASELYNRLTSKDISFSNAKNKDLITRYMEIEQELKAKTETGVLHIVFTIVSLMGILVLIYAILLVLAYFFDIFNVFSDISILYLITFGGCRAVTNIKDIERFGLPKDTKYKYLSLRGILVRWCICTVLGMALLSSSQIYSWVMLLYYNLSGFFGI